MAEEALDFAHEIDHPYSVVWALYHCGFLSVSRGRFDDVLETSQRLAVLSDEHDFVLWRTLATVLEGVARTALGDPERGVVLTEQGVQLYQGLAPPPIFWPMVLGLRAGVHAMAGDLPRSLELVDEAIAIFEPMGLIPPEMAIRRSQLLVGLNGPDDPEAARLLEGAIETAGQLGLRLSELEAQTRLVQLRRALGRVDDGAAALADLYDTFTEGLEEAKLVAAREVLDA